ncbi:MAG: SufE family protein [Bacteroidales bacterium]
MSEINDVQDQIIEEFSIFDDWMDKYAYIIEQGGNLEKIDPSLKGEDKLINGCQSKVWLISEYIDGKIELKAESDAVIVKGIISLLLRVYSGRTPDEIMNAEPYFIEKIGLAQHLSPTRSNGLLAMIKQIKLYASAYKKMQA